MILENLKQVREIKNIDLRSIDLEKNYIKVKAGYRLGKKISGKIEQAYLLTNINYKARNFCIYKWLSWWCI